MDKHSHNSDDLECQRTAKVRFKQQLYSSIGGGMIFALVGVVTTALLHGATGVLASAFGIAAVGAIGLVCVYAAAKYLSKAISLDQEAQAEKINGVSKGRGIALQPTIETTRPTTLPYGMGVAQDVDSPAKDQPDTTLSDISYHNKITMPMGEKITLH